MKPLPPKSKRTYTIVPYTTLFRSAILVKGEVIYKKTFGNKKGENNRINEDTLFGLASLSKPVSTIAIILMAEKNSLNFDKKIKLPYIKHDITLKIGRAHV